MKFDFWRERGNSLALIFWRSRKIAPSAKRLGPQAAGAHRRACGHSPSALGPVRSARRLHAPAPRNRRSCRDGCWACRTRDNPSACVCGMRPLSEQRQPHAPMAEIGQRNHRASADAQQMVQHFAGAARRLNGLAQDHDVEYSARDNRQDRYRRRPARPDSPRVTQAFTFCCDSSRPRPSTCLVAHQMLEQRAVAAADVEHARALRNHFRDGREIGPQRERRSFHAVLRGDRN